MIYPGFSLIRQYWSFISSGWDLYQRKPIHKSQLKVTRSKMWFLPIFTLLSENMVQGQGHKGQGQRSRGQGRRGQGKGQEGQGHTVKVKATGRSFYPLLTHGMFYTWAFSSIWLLVHANSHSWLCLARLHPANDWIFALCGNHLDISILKLGSLNYKGQRSQLFAKELLVPEWKCINLPDDIHCNLAIEQNYFGICQTKFLLHQWWCCRLMVELNDMNVKWLKLVFSIVSFYGHVWFWWRQNSG